MRVAIAVQRCSRTGRHTQDALKCEVRYLQVMAL